MTHRSSALLLIANLQQRLNQVFRELGESLAAGGETGEWQPAIDVVSSGDSVTLIAEVPGLRAGDLTIEVSGSLVIVHGERPARPGGDRGRFLCVETGRGRFRREVQLLHSVNGHLARARLADGVLTVEFPRIQDQRHTPRTVVIEEQREEQLEEGRQERNDQEGHQ